MKLAGPTSPAHTPLLADVAARLESAPAFREAVELLARSEDATLAAPALVRPLLTAALFAARPRPTLVVVPGDEEACRYARCLGAFLPREVVLPLPPDSSTPWSREAPDVAVTGRRARALHALSTGRDAVVVASAGALLRRLPPRDAQAFEPLALEAGGTLDLDEAAGTLARLAYERVDVADEPGRFAIRGGTLDVFPADALYPVRAELFGDEVESLRRYVPSTGQSIGDAGRTEVFACREVRLSGRGARSVRELLGERSFASPGLARDLDLMEQGVYFNGVEAYLPYLYREPRTVTDYLGADTLVEVIEPRALFDDMTRRHDTLASQASAAGQDARAYYAAPGEVDLGGRQRVTLVSLMRAEAGVAGEVSARRPEVAGGPEKLAAALRGLLGTGYSVVMTARDRESKRRLARMLVDSGLTVADHREVLGGEPEPLPPGIVHLAIADIPAGFVVPDAAIAVVSVDDAFPRTSSSAAEVRTKARHEAFAFDFAPGDHVVHAVHGIALFRQMTRKTVLEAERDYLTLEYAKGDRLYVPVEQLDRVTKYVGPDQAAPKVTRLDTADWSKATSKARKAARRLAFDLVDLYARRSAATGYAFGSDTPWQREVESAFPYEGTPDQLAAIEAVKADMESPEPMDRLVCGDVGYGKTEVAIRAAFKAAQDGKQVIVLCPTTILAQQHHTTFSERFAPYPVRVEVLSRFRSPRQQEDAVEAFGRGEVDVLIGTHRLLSPDVTPKDLGLVIVDEEQRFGVEHKEHLKHLREQVDVLTMTATPIPRTLQMALSGVRDISIIDTPPPDRFPVQVHVGEYDARLACEAIRREIERGGQVYYVSDRVRTIQGAERRVREAAPEARIGVAHGRMSEHRLERVMESFAAGELDVLVSTTIVESGIDNPHTNTLMIEDSQRLGLAQLYQLKGRVGRSHRKAFAYFFFPRSSRLTEQAYERLGAMREFTGLGSGIRLAMRDLEIRGAGSLLGAEQHGDMSAVGFELYSQMLRDAVAEARGEPKAAFPEVRVEVPVPAFLPEEYVPDVDERIRFYRRLAGAVSAEAAEEAAEELAAVRGALPEAARNLVAVARIKALADVLGVESVIVSRRRLVVQPLRIGAEAARRLAAGLGAAYVPARRRLSLDLPDGSAAEATLGALSAILSHVRPYPVSQGE